MEESEKKNSAEIIPPFKWRCRICSKEGASPKLQKCCGLRVRQLAPLSDEGNARFTQFLEKATWKFVPATELYRGPGFVDEEDIISVSIEAGKLMENHLNKLSISIPEYFELFDRRTDHLRISDLKSEKKIRRALNSIEKLGGELPEPLETAPIGVIEDGHIFDEFFSMLAKRLGADNWSNGNRVELTCKELDLNVGGTTDMTYNGIPVETKTVPLLPIRGHPKVNKNTFKSKWKKNYLDQIAMYSNACCVDWMFLLLVSRNEGDFTIYPVNANNRMEKLRKDWRIWSKDKNLMKRIGKIQETL